ncbi:MULTISPECIES: alpha/beta fold hydrolase [unclassified Pseudomonas]|uniref:alpha/beta fold hydrolase n=1 Tax=unclassified Pseudomonas TaxID=196821 RepID=UPI000C883EEE|nr:MULTISPECIES: alpha/beta hydrolase [unclassified Pseudomonas]PMZ94905.1 alpha/beta hydrolase [Pseudomonas sp. FW305-42]PNA23804.1 alpha/beta hydrolase [Pseudomonas sp. MPR-R1B]PNB24641.1 alpha/beta hydrolase [Pseudomonas sp. DP16D-E2]PNB42061.1 alpha/beta hydrolase [Pseudomonas sp. FW305-17]PNB58477.1 alpha/beta hydrolase [Pseudomonas sp. GW531-E2]
MELIPWSHECAEGFTLRGWRTPASGRPLLHFLHGNGFCSLAYQPMLMRLGEHFDLWLSDVQGHGDSDHGGVFLGWNRTAALAVEAFEAGRGEYGDVPRFALGHSFGGVLTGLILAAEPQLFQRAVLLDPVLFSRRMIGVMGAAAMVGLHRRHALARKAATRRSHWPDREAAQASLQGRGIFKGWTDAALQAYVEHAIGDCGEGVVLKCRPSREVEIFSSFPERMWQQLSRIQTPTRILYGEQTYPFVPHSVHRLVALNGQVSAQQVAGGHCFMQEDPITATEQVVAFLQH